MHLGFFFLEKKLQNIFGLTFYKISERIYIFLSKD